MDTVALIVNPVAGSARSRRTAAGAADLLRAAGWTPEVLPTSRPGEAADLAARAAERHAWVAVAGGDGTASEAARGLIGTDAALVLLPTGSGNDLAFALGVTDAASGVAALRGGRTVAIDVGRCDGAVFVNSCGLFFDGAVSLRAAGISRRWGVLRYPLATASLFGRYRPVAARWEFAGGPDGAGAIDGAWLLAEIGNGPRCGGAFLLTPRAVPDDGLLDVCLVRDISWARFARLTPRAARGRHLDDPDVRYLRVRSCSFEIEADAPFHRDGEAGMMPAGRHEVVLEARRLRVRVPAAGEENG